MSELWTGDWVMKIDPDHYCVLPKPTDPPTFGYGSEWRCDCGLHWIWSNGGGWLGPEEYERRKEENVREGIPNQPTNTHAHPWFRLPGRPSR